MYVHIVRSEHKTWVLSRIAQSIQLPKVSIGFEPRIAVDINFYIAYHAFSDWIGKFPGPCHVCWMTHYPHEADNENHRRARFHRAMNHADWCLAMCRQTAEHCPPEKTSIWRGAPDKMFVKETLVLGVCCKLSRRKRPDRIELMKALPGVEVRVTGGTVPHDKLPEFYRGLDYLVVTSDSEGGPYPVMEAMAMGIPVIAPDVGFCWDFPVIRYDGTDAGLLQVVQGLRAPADPWESESKKLELIFEQILSLRRQRT